ncbi:hypothetical protein PVK06_049324 [Gossypium arboreum]|uniref:Uncharacterized protein n=1 Tax=Gossypium arboreum TaxID=29729 RepID=A0ABR0MIQ5_GOSAR|nr:hypothetical protein PVK06_049324 [Gossypium arboreum]
MEHRPNIISLLETRVSGSKADKVIAKLGFQFSHRVEAVGYAGGIWIETEKNRISTIRESLGNWLFDPEISRSNLSDTIVTFHGEPIPKNWIFLNADGAVSKASGKAAV